MRALAAIATLGLAACGSGAWVSRGPAAEDASVRFYAVLSGFDSDGLHDAFLRVSNPRHPDYGKYMSNTEIGGAFGAPEADAAVVVAWAEEHGASARPTTTGDRVRVDCTASTARAMLGVQLHAYSHERRPGTLAVRAHEQPILPSRIARVVRHVYGLHRFPEAPRPSAMPPSAFGAGPTAGGRVIGVGALLAGVTGDTFPLVGASEGDHQFSLIIAARCPGGSTPSKASVDAHPNDPCAPNATFASASVSFRSRDSGAEATVSVAASNFAVLGHPLVCYFSDQHSFAGPHCRLKLPPSAALPNYEALDVTSVSVTFTAGGAKHVLTSANGLGEPLFGMASATAQFLRGLYNVPPNLKGTAPGNRIAIASFLSEFYSPDDLRRYQDAAGVPRAPVARDRGDGTNDPSHPGGEASLDVQTVAGMAPGIPLTVFSTDGGNKYAEPYMEWLEELGELSQDEIPLVVSTSYGDDEFDWREGSNATDQDVMAVNEKFKMQGLRGITLVFSAGDDGVASFTARGKGVDEGCSVYHPEFPASSPYVTAIGGSQLGTDAEPVCTTNMYNGITAQCAPRERVCTSERGGVITGGGGFSTLFDRDDSTAYQNEVVDDYLKTQGTDLPPDTRFNRKGRAYPDVSGLAAKYPVLINGTWTFLYGTSASAPLTASLFALVNDARLREGLPPLGFVNPLLYQTFADHPAVFRDIVVGDIACVASHNSSARLCCRDAFKAVPGWDPASGLGSLDFSAFLHHAMRAAHGHRGDGHSGDDDGLEGPVATLQVVVGVLGTIIALAVVLGIVVWVRASRRSSAGEPYSEMAEVRP